MQLQGFSTDSHTFVWVSALNTVMICDGIIFNWSRFIFMLEYKHQMASHWASGSHLNFTFYVQHMLFSCQFWLTPIAPSSPTFWLSSRLDVHFHLWTTAQWETFEGENFRPFTSFLSKIWGHGICWWHKQTIHESFLHNNRISHQSVEVFSLKSFQLYGIIFIR